MSNLTDLIHGKDSHVGPLAAVEDLPWEVAGRRVAHLPHTIWQQLGHMNYWIDHTIKHIDGGRPELPADAEQSWPQADGPTDEVAWRHEVALLRTNLAQLVALAEARASTLNRIIDPKRGTTVEGDLWTVVTHNSYHTGQIVQLRQALGAWPPPGGGLT